MIHLTRGNLLDAGTEAVVNTVNTVGVMGKGIALMFKERYPENYRLYAAACASRQVTVGEMFVTQGEELGGPKWIINFPTKQHWRNPSKLEWVITGLEALKKVICEKGIKSVVLPALGCGNGGLDWDVVLPRIEAVLGDLEGVEVFVYVPQ